MSRNVPHRRKCLYRVTEWLAVRAQQMTVSPVIKADGVNVNLAALDVCQDEALWHASLDLRKPVVREHFPHPGLMGVPQDEVEVLVFARLLADQGVYTPAAVQPYIDCGSSEPPKDLDDIGLSHNGHIAQRTGGGPRWPADVELGSLSRKRRMGALRIHSTGRPLDPD